MSTYVCSDVHGCLDRFEKLLENINFSNKDKMYVLGDVIDRGEYGIELLKKCRDTEGIELLLGNHEFFMLEYLRKIKVCGDFYKENVKDINFKNSAWISPNNGGMKTLSSFVKEKPEERDSLLEYLLSLPVLKIIEVNGDLFHLSHSGTMKKLCENVTGPMEVRQTDVNKYEVDDIVWLSPYRSDLYIPPEAYPENMVSIFGHVPVQRIYNSIGEFAEGVPEKVYQVYKKGNLINIDGGCAYASNRNVETALSCIELETMNEIYIDSKPRIRESDIWRGIQ